MLNRQLGGLAVIAQHVNRFILGFDPHLPSAIKP